MLFFGDRPTLPKPEQGTAPAKPPTPTLPPTTGSYAIVAKKRQARTSAAKNEGTYPLIHERP